jgi:hypothetical protein
LLKTSVKASGSKLACRWANNQWSSQ